MRGILIKSAEKKVVEEEVLADNSEAVALDYVMSALPWGAKVIQGGDWRSFGRNLPKP